ncbi:ATP synthase subunit I [Achromobacter piechaudii]|uniref:ATP synthase subunit I n=1 Tax=Achromobacter piechaudii TaxID=72556 RepID=UPI0009E5AD07
MQGALQDERQRQQQGLSGQDDGGQSESDDDIKVLVLSDADRAALDAQASRGLLLALAAQGAMGLAAAVIAGVFGGAAAGWSALAGAGAYFIPNALFALRLVVSVRAGKANPFTFLSGELIKLFATALLLWMLSRVAQDSLVWPAALLGLILTLKGYLLLLMFRKLS